MFICLTLVVSQGQIYITMVTMDAQVHRHEESFVELFGRSDVIFLTSESPNIISGERD